MNVNSCGFSWGSSESFLCMGAMEPLGLNVLLCCVLHLDIDIFERNMNLALDRTTGSVCVACLSLDW